MLSVWRGFIDVNKKVTIAGLTGLRGTDPGNHLPSEVTVKISLRLLVAFFLCIEMFFFQGCLRYMTHERSKAVVEGIDIDQTLIVAEKELERGGRGSVLTLWAIRDQKVSVAQAHTINRLYQTWIDSMKKDFDIWHLTWAIGNLYRLGDERVKATLDSSWHDASQRAARLGGLADRFVNGTKLYMGDAHFLGRAYARRHLVVPGNRRYLATPEEYENRHRDKGE